MITQLGTSTLGTGQVHLPQPTERAWTQGLSGIAPPPQNDSQVFQNLTFQGGSNLQLFHNTGQVNQSLNLSPPTNTTYATFPQDSSSFSNDSSISSFETRAAGHLRHVPLGNFDMSAINT